MDMGCRALAGETGNEDDAVAYVQNREERIELPRRKASVDTPYGTIEVKVATRPGGSELVSPEYESCKQAAQESGASLLDVYEAVRKAWEAK